MKPKPIAPQQALNNFKLFLELSPRNSYEDYRAAVCEIAQTVLDAGIVGDDRHKAKKRVLIEVLGGVAECTRCSPGVKVTILDHDNERGGI